MALLLLVASLVGARCAAGMMQFSVDKSNALQQTTALTYRITFTKSSGANHACLTEIAFANSGGAPLAATYVSAGSCYGCSQCDGCLANYGQAAAAFDGISSNDNAQYWWCTMSGSFTTAGSIDVVGSTVITFQLPEHPSTYSLERPRTGPWVAVSWVLEEQLGDGTWNTLSTVTDEPIALSQGPFALQASSVTSSASATGDPHLQNIHGQRFDLMRPGNTVLIHIPRGVPVKDSMLTVEADAVRLGESCADLYFQTINITGKWADAGRWFDAQFVQDEKPTWAKFGPVEIKVAHGRTEKGFQYLNFYVKHLLRAGATVGGLLGEDDHADAAAPEDGCHHAVALQKHTQVRAERHDASVAKAYQ